MRNLSIQFPPEGSGYTSLMIGDYEYQAGSSMQTFSRGTDEIGPYIFPDLLGNGTTAQIDLSTPSPALLEHADSWKVRMRFGLPTTASRPTDWPASTLADASISTQGQATLSARAATTYENLGNNQYLYHHRGYQYFLSAYPQQHRIPPNALDYTLSQIFDLEITLTRDVIVTRPQVGNLGPSQNERPYAIPMSYINMASTEWWGAQPGLRPRLYALDVSWGAIETSGIPPLRHRQNGLNSGGPPLRHRQNGGQTGGPPLRHRQNGL